MLYPQHILRHCLSVTAALRGRKRWRACKLSQQDANITSSLWLPTGCTTAGLQQMKQSPPRETMPGIAMGETNGSSLRQRVLPEAQEKAGA